MLTNKLSSINRNRAVRICRCTEKRLFRCSGTGYVLARHKKRPADASAEDASSLRMGRSTRPDGIAVNVFPNLFCPAESFLHVVTDIVSADDFLEFRLMNELRRLL